MTDRCCRPRSRGAGAALVAGAGLLAAACAGGTATERPTPVVTTSRGPSTPGAAASVPRPAPRAETTTTGPAVPDPAPAPVMVAPAPSAWRLLAVGDVLMDDTEAAGVDPFAAVRPALSRGDLVVVNLEMAVTLGGVAEEKAFAFRAPPSAAARLATAGVHVANLANNHSLDFGEAGLRETLGHLAAAGVDPVGAGLDSQQAYAPAIRSVGGVRVAVVGASRVFPRRSWAAGVGPGLASAYDEARLLGAVRNARAGADVVVVAIHWGREGSPCPDPDQERLGAALLGAGATVVLGSHPHVLQPVVADADGVLAYSLGNFVFHRRRGPTGDTAVLEVRFEGARVVGHQVHPHRLDAGPPRPATPAGAARVAAAVLNPCLPPPPPAPYPAPPLPAQVPGPAGP